MKRIHSRFSWFHFFNFFGVCNLVIEDLTQIMEPTTMKYIFLGVLLSISCFAETEVNHMEQEERFQKFENSMRGVRFTGLFTIEGSDDSPTKETYEIKSVQKLGSDNLWIFTARIKYGIKDVIMPLPLPVKWVGSIPVITMHNLSIPGLGTFSAHVVIDGKKYAGTWSHGNVGGHLFGSISKINPAQSN